MSNKEILLTISFPTYNREAILERTLLRLIHEIEKFNLQQEVEIVISDNCSTDGTEALVTKIKAKTNVQINYNKNHENLGVIRNILKLIELSNGKYWMFYGDDDLIPENTLPDVVKLLKQNAYSVYMFKQYGKENQAFKDYSSDAIISLSDVARDYFYKIGNAGIFAVQTSFAREALKLNYNKLLQTCWPQTEIFFIAGFLSGNDKVYASTLCTAYNDYGTLIYYNSYYYFETQLFSLLRSAISIDSVLGNQFIKKASSSIYGIQFFDSYKLRILEEYIFFDFDYEKAQMKKTISEAVKSIPSQWAKEIIAIDKMLQAPDLLNKTKLYLIYLNKSRQLLDPKISLWSKLKVLSPLGHSAMIKKQLEEKRALYRMKGKGITENTGYF